MRLSLLIAVLTIPTALFAQGMPVDLDPEPIVARQPASRVDPVEPAPEVLPPGSRPVRYSQPKIRYPDAPAASVLVAASAGGVH